MRNDSHPHNQHRNKKQQISLTKAAVKSINLLVCEPNINLQSNQWKQRIKVLNKQLYQFKIFSCLEQLQKILNQKQKIIISMKIAHIVLSRFLNNNINPVLMNTYVLIMKKNKQYQNGVINKHKLQQLIPLIKSYNLCYFCQAFTILLPQKLLQQNIRDLSLAGEYGSAFKLLSLHKVDMDKINFIAKHAITQRERKTVNYVIEEIFNLGYKREDFKKLHQRALLLQMFDIYKSQGYQYAEQVFRPYGPILTKIGNHMQKDKKINKREFLSFCLRNKSILPYLSDKNIQKQLATFGEFDYVKNPLLTNKFQPSSNQYIKLPQLNINEKDVQFINSSSPNLQNCLQNLLKSKVLGLDTQSFVPRTKFLTEEDLICTIQISNGQKAYIFDAKDIKNPIVGLKLSQFFYNPNKILIGHTLKQDLDVTMKVLGLMQEPKCKCIDVKNQFKLLYPGQRAGLQSISQVVLKKPICKKYTLTDWSRRPLLKNQIHYAALDAVVVLHIYKQLQIIKKKTAKN